MALSEASPTAKALRTLELLQLRPGITAEQLAMSLAVSGRAVRRYVQTLREAGIPVDSSPGRYGGYRLGRGTRQPPIQFTAGEALGLVMAVLDGHHAAADPDDPAGSALGKLIRSLPGNVGRQAEHMRSHAQAAGDPHAARPDPAVTSALVDAIAARRRVRIAYRSASGSARDHEVDPWAVVVRHGRWYLLGLSQRAAAARTYRVDRVAGVAELAATAEPPSDLDPVAFLEEHLGKGWPLETHVVFDAPYHAIAPYIPAPMGRLVPEGPRCRLRGTTSNPAMVAGEWLAAIPFPFEVAGGPELRDAVAELARRLRAAVPDLD